MGEANLNPESETTLRDILLKKMFSFEHFPKENILLLGEVMPYRIPYAKIKHS